MNHGLPGWNDVRRITDELGLQIHLASMDARDRWHALQLRLAKLEHTVAHSGEQAVTHELSEIRGALLHLRDDMLARARGDFTTGW